MPDKVFYESKDHTWLVKEGFLGEPRIVYPWKVNGRINWKNFLIGGSWTKFIGLVVFILFILFVSFQYNHDIKECINIKNSCYFYNYTININNIPLGENEGDVVILNVTQDYLQNKSQVW